MRLKPVWFEPQLFRMWILVDGKKLLTVAKKKIFMIKSVTYILVLAIILSPLCGVALAAGMSDEELYIAICDIDGNGSVSAADARLLLRTSSGFYYLLPTEAASKANVKMFGDINGDGKITAADARLLLRCSSNLEDIYDELYDLIEDIQDVPPAPSPGINPDLDKVLVYNELLTPEQSHGLGTASMCKVTADYAETTPADAQNDRSYPNYSTLCRGTYDYVTAEETYNDKGHYILASGRKIYAENASLIEDGYKMPMNELSATAVYVENTTDIYIKTKWAVPTSVSFEPQKYEIGYEGREWNLSEFTAEYMDIVFYYTDVAEGSFSFDSSRVIDDFEWIDGEDTVTLRLYLKWAGGVYGYSISLTESGYFKISLKNPPGGLNGKRIVIDAGHGGGDPGATITDVFEKDISLPVALELKRLLEARGAMVTLTRSSDVEVLLKERVALTRSVGADLFISVHCDSADASAHGTHTFYYYPQSMPLARAIQDEMVSAYKNKIYADNEDMQECDKGIKFYPFFVTRLEQCPAVLVEMGFITNEIERQVLTEESNQKILAEAIAVGVARYFSSVN